MNVPSDIVEWFRGVFAAANRRLAEKLLERSGYTGDQPRHHAS